MATMNHNRHTKVTIKKGSSVEHHRVTPEQANAVATLLRQQQTDNENGTALPNGNSSTSPISTAEDNDGDQD